MTEAQFMGHILLLTMEELDLDIDTAIEYLDLDDEETGLLEDWLAVPAFPLGYIQ